MTTWILEDWKKLLSSTIVFGDFCLIFGNFIHWDSTFPKMETLWPGVPWGDGLTSAILQSIKDFAEATPPVTQPRRDGISSFGRVEIRCRSKSWDILSELPSAIPSEAPKNCENNHFMLGVSSRGMKYQKIMPLCPHYPSWKATS